jgi:hypothetical protein
MNPISVALRGKGPLKFLQRGMSIANRYGITPEKMDRSLAQFAAVLRQFECSATLPITTVVLQRNPHVIEKYQAQGIEFAVHGYRHLDHSQLSPTEQQTQLAMAKQIFVRIGIPVHGFRGPYLHWNPDTLAVLRQQGFVYDSSQGLAWHVLDGCETPAYRQALNFYGALSASCYPSLPSLKDDLVCIPYGLPDDEALVERLNLGTPAERISIWLAILRRTHNLGELFTLGLHPERISLCLEPLTAVLAEARSLTPPIWIARLDEIARWWRARMEATVKIADAANGGLHLTVNGPSGVTVLARATQVDAPTVPWADGYRRVEAMEFTVHAQLRPFIGLSPVTSQELADFLQQQGYIIEISEEGQAYSYYFDQAEFTAEQERSLLAQIEGTDRPLVRLGRWPNGTHSALAISGDIDALTLWDYGLRFWGK